MTNLLEVKDLKTRFHTPEGTVFAVNGASFHLEQGETLAVVGESGCGKSVTMLSILGLIPVPPGEIASGRALYLGKDLLQMSEEDLEGVRGKEIAMIFQDPMTSLNPVLTIGRQITESLRTHMDMNQEAATRRAIHLLEAVGIGGGGHRLAQHIRQAGEQLGLAFGGRARFEGVRVGLRPALPDGLPAIGPPQRAPRVVVATGHYRNGVLLAPVTAEIVERYIVEGVEDPSLAAVSPDRFLS